MRIVVDISPIDEVSTSFHKFRGVGKYITLLAENLEKFDHKNQYVFSSKPQEISGKVDLIHYPYFDPFFVTLPFINKKPTVVTVHDLIPIEYKKDFPVGVKGNLKWGINKVLLKRTSGIITNSQASKEQIMRIAGISSKRIFPICFAVDDAFCQLDLKNKEKESFLSSFRLPEKFLLYVGDVTWNKNLVNIAHAVKKNNIPIVMVGKALKDNNFDQSNPWNKSRIEFNSLTQNDPLFIKLGFVETKYLVKLYNLAELLLMPSFYEGFGLPVLEALKSGCPVITSNNGGLPEVAGQAAIYVDPENPQAISEAIETIVDSSDLKIKLIENGIDQAKKFTVERMISDTISVYNSYYCSRLAASSRAELGGRRSRENQYSTRSEQRQHFIQTVA